MEMYFPPQEYEKRWRQVDEGMQCRGLDAAVVWGRSAGGFERCADLLYLTSYYGTHSGQGLDTPVSTARGIGAVLLRRGQEPELMADEPGPNPDLLATDSIHWSKNTIAGMANLLKVHGIKGKVGFVGSDFFPLKYWTLLQGLAPDVEWCIEDELVCEARLIKSPLELEAMREGGRTVSKALSRLMEGLVKGKKEAEAAAAAEVVRRRRPCPHDPGEPWEDDPLLRPRPAERLQPGRAGHGRSRPRLDLWAHVPGILARSRPYRRVRRAPVERAEASGRKLRRYR